MLKTGEYNTLINHTIYTIDLLFKEKDSPQELIDFLYLITVGMILSYGDDYISDIYDVIASIKFENKEKSQNELFYTNNDSLLYDNPTMHNYLNKYYDLASNFPDIKVNYELAFKNIDSSFLKTLEYLTHEINAILFRKNKNYSLKDNLKIRFDYITKNIIDCDKNKDDENIFNKVFNVLQAEDIIKNILLLKSVNIKNNRFKNIIKKLLDVDYTTYKFEGLDILVNLMRPLYEYNDIKFFINNNMFLNNDIIEKEFDKVLGKNSYLSTCKKLDNLNNLIKNTKNGSYNNYYVLSIEYVSIRNNFVNKYINKKLLNQIS